MNKKGAFDIKDIPWIATVFGLGIIILAIATQIISDVRTDHVRPSQTIINESDAVTLVWGNQTNMSLNSDYITILAIWNCTAESPLIGVGNYTVFPSAGKIQCDFVDSGNVSIPSFGDYVCVNYTHRVNDEVYNITSKGLLGQKNFSNWFTTIGLVIGAIIVLGALAYFGYVTPRS